MAFLFNGINTYMNIKDFFKRNKPIFVFGIVLAMVFTGVSVVAELISPNNEIPILKKTETPITDSYTNNAYTLPKEEIQTNPTNEIEISQEEIDTKLGKLEISFTESGFIPKNTSAYVGQALVIKNSTPATINIIQTTNIFANLKDITIGIQPEDEYEFRLDKSGLWTYKETISNSNGAIYINPKDALLKKLIEL